MLMGPSPGNHGIEENLKWVIILPKEMGIM